MEMESYVHVKIVCIFFSFQTGDLSLQEAKILDHTLQKVIQTISLTNWTALTGP